MGMESGTRPVIGDKGTDQLFFDSVSYTIGWCMLQEIDHVEHVQPLSRIRAQISLSINTSSPYSISIPLSSLG